MLLLRCLLAILLASPVFGGTSIQALLDGDVTITTLEGFGQSGRHGAYLFVDAVDGRPVYGEYEQTYGGRVFGVGAVELGDDPEYLVGIGVSPVDGLGFRVFGRSDGKAQLTTVWTYGGSFWVFRGFADLTDRLIAEPQLVFRFRGVEVGAELSVSGNDAQPYLLIGWAP